MENKLYLLIPFSTDFFEMFLYILIWGLLQNIQDSKPPDT